VIIGVDGYAEGSGLKRLGYAVSDAVAVRDILRDEFGFSKSCIRFLTEAEAKRRAIEDTLRAWSDDPEVVAQGDRPGTEDFVLVFFAGHGLEKGERGYLAAFDSTKDPDSCVRVGWLREQVARMAPRHKLILLDSCYSASLFTLESALPAVEGDRRDAAPRGDRPAPAADRGDGLGAGAAPGGGRSRQYYFQHAAFYGFSAGRFEPVADQAPGGDHSPFTTALLDVLGDRADSTSEDHAFRFIDLANQVQDSVADHNAQIPRWQQLGPGDGEIVFRPNQPDTRQTSREKDYEATLNELTERLTQFGKDRLSVDPAAALGLALETIDLRPTSDAVELLHAAIRSTPVWCKIGPKTPERAEAELTLPAITPHDVFATDPDATLVLTTDKMARSDGPKDGLGLTIREVPTNDVVASRRLNPGEFVMTPRGPYSNLFATLSDPEGERRVEVYELSRTGLERSLLSLKSIRDIAFTNGSWPVHALSTRGEILSYERAGAEPVRRGKVEGGEAIFAHPTGESLAILCPETDGQRGKISWTGLGRGATAKEFEWRGLPSFNRELYNTPMCDFRWGPYPSQFVLLVMSRASQEPKDLDTRFQFRSVLAAGDAKIGKVQIIEESDYREHGLNRWFVEADPSGRRIVLTSHEGEHGIVTEVLDLDWRAGGSDAVTGVKRLKEGRLVGKRDESRPSYAAAAVVSPLLNYIVVASYLKSTDEDGVSIDGVGLIESWDLSRLQPTTGEPSPTNSGPVVGGPKPFAQRATLQPEPVYHIASRSPELLGTVPILRLAYSRDARRLVAWDVRGVAHVFRVRTSQGYYRMPEEWDKRLRSPEVRFTGLHSQHLTIQLGDGESSWYSGMAKRMVRLSDPLPDSPVLAARPADDNRSLIVLKTSGVYKVPSSGAPMEIHSFERPAIAGSIDDRLATAVFMDGASFYDARTLDEIGALDTKDKEASQALARLRDAFVSEEPIFDDGRGRAATKSSLSRWVELSSRSYRTCFLRDGSFETWHLARTDNPKILTMKRTGPGIPVFDSKPRSANAWASSRRLLDPDVLFVNRGDYLPNTVASLSQYDLSSQTDIHKYELPNPGWPGNIAEVEAVLRIDRKTIILLRYWKPGVFGDRYAVGVWNFDGGKCLDSIDLGNFEAHPPYIDTVGGQGLALVMFWSESDRKTVNLVRLGDGARLWTGVTPFDQSPPPFLSLNKAGQYDLLDADGYSQMCLYVATRGGVLFWRQATLVPPPAGELEKIRRLRADRRRGKSSAL
jgi:hypothetical protein